MMEKKITAGGVIENISDMKTAGGVIKSVSDSYTNFSLPPMPSMPPFPPIPRPAFIGNARAMQH